jgi:hypothetical protein
MNHKPAIATFLAAVAMMVASCTPSPGPNTATAPQTIATQTAPQTIPTHTVTVTPPPPPTSGSPVSSPASPPADVLPSETATVIATPTPEPTKTEIDVVAPAPAQELSANREQVFCSGGTHEGCHSYGDMNTYLTHVLALISPMFDELYGPANRPSAFYYVATGETGPTACTTPQNTPAPYDSASYMYCPADQAIYTGQDKLWQFYAGLGDAAPAVGYAHEWGHHIQNIMGVPSSQDPQHRINKENQADCIAGAWLYYADVSGYLEYPDDLGDINALLQAIASAESDVTRGHGTLEERSKSVDYGYNYGLRGCNQYFPTTPVYNG